MHGSIATCLGNRSGEVANVLFRNHTSFIKDPAPEMGRGVRVNHAVRFH